MKQLRQETYGAHIPVANHAIAFYFAQQPYKVHNRGGGFRHLPTHLPSIFKGKIVFFFKNRREVSREVPHLAGPGWPTLPLCFSPGPPLGRFWVILLADLISVRVVTKKSINRNSKNLLASFLCNEECDRMFAKN